MCFFVYALIEIHIPMHIASSIGLKREKEQARLVCTSYAKWGNTKMHTIIHTHTHTVIMSSGAITICCYGDDFGI